ncbi:MAG: SGNH/GDSL hydrolase family protein [Gammaproteobacteria bacterium]|jgi:phospholipase/lecithinase/hemolysin
MKIRNLCSLAIIAVALTSAAASNAGDIEHGYGALYVFGDSLSDPGNVYALTGTSVLPPYTLIPTAPYAVGGFHFTNGKTWVERLAARLRLPNGGKPAFGKPGVYGNYAFGASRAGGSESPLFSFAGQIDSFFADIAGEARGDALHVVWFGSNDIRDALLAASSDPTLATSQAIIAAAIQAEAQGIARLHAAGARKFLVLNAPNVALSPIVASLGPQSVAAALLLTQAFNIGLADALDGLEGTLPGIEIARFDVFALLSSLAANPQAFGIHNTTDPCIRPGETTRVYCSGRNRYLFWDSIHPTAAAHRLLARAVADEFRR